MPEMPFAVAKGKVLAAMDERYSSKDAAGNPTERITMLAVLRSGKPGPNSTLADTVGKMDFLDGKNPNKRDYPSRIHMRGHVNEDWFGFDVDKDATGPTSGGKGHPKAGGPKATPTTGWWRNWKGDAEGVFRRGLCRAIEVSLGIGPGADPSERTRAWPIEFFWVCGAPRFEVYVNWSQDSPPSTSGRVTVHIFTPGIDANWTAAAYSSDLRNVIGGVGTAPVDKARLLRNEGMIVVGQDTRLPTSTGGKKGDPWSQIIAATSGVKETYLTFDADGVGT